MFSKLPSAALVAVAASGLVSAQTSTACNPLQKTCPVDPAFGKEVKCDFTKGECGAFQAAQATTIKYNDQGAVFTINSEGDAPTIHTGKYIFFGEIEVEVQAAPGQGIVTSAVLQSDDLDEIDLEWIGSDPGQFQSNYFSKGDTSTYDRGAYHPVANAVAKSHTYGIKWTSDAITWSVDNNTPMQVKLGTWVAGGEKASPGTVEWAGGRTDFNKKPFVGIYKSIKIVDYAGGNQPANGAIKEYTYGDHTGSAKSIQVVRGQSDSKQVNGENGLEGGEGQANGSSSHNENKSLIEAESSSTDDLSATRAPSGTSGRPLQTGTSGGDDEGDDRGQQPQTTLATVTGASNSTATSLPSSGSKGSSTSVPTSAAGLARRDVTSFGAVAVAALVMAQLLL
ncbi:glycosyl hydrolases family 16 domain-containing protein [Hirsutella rhossiliensis]|uniref:Glycosyl hydrolases family 16 domain-containing protein n=1 Tax=Hirsutella rhossiliensis TaxID=111463 RepID=A0A9P8MPE9_9HYPO|nr:glycosyl hydrolases family 16 domain-containing protein [Hirsutella rhossiliensis]KAH0958657.1 glycosyl hydrolases family 16 domain-containing protein [Hirsutella rhossiliensis]